MKIVNTIKDLREELAIFRRQGANIGFVPTMGALHKGHITLLTKAVSECEVVVCSIFVNPLQFNNPDDLKKYPHTPEEDLAMLQQAGCQLVYLPLITEIYPPGFQALCIPLNNIDKYMEGAYRPGHFEGMLTVVKRFFDLVMPDKAYFGMKDFQQLALVRHMVNYFQLPIIIVPCETVRESDGLALSSRNRRLNPDQRKQAPAIYAALLHAKKHFRQWGIENTKTEVAKIIMQYPALRIEYIEICHIETLQPLPEGDTEKAGIFVAVYADEVRLIDNLILT